MAKKISFGKLLAGAVLAGVAVYGIYRVLEKKREEENISAKKTACKEPADNGSSAETADVRTFAEAAEHAYATVQHGSGEAMDKLREAVGPRSGEVIQTVGEAAEEVGRTVAESAAKIRDILKETPEETPAAGSSDRTPAGDAADRTPAGEAPACEAVEEFFDEET